MILRKSARSIESIRSPLDRDGLERLHDELRRDPEAQRRYRRGYRGPYDAMDVLRWNLEPDSADDPESEIPAIEAVAFARADGDEARAAQRAALVRLNELQSAALAAERELAAALRRYLEPVPDSAARRLLRSRAAWFLAGLVVAVAASSLVAVSLRLTVPPGSLEVFDRPAGAYDLAMAGYAGTEDPAALDTVRVVYDDAARSEVLLAWTSGTQVCITLHRAEAPGATGCSSREGFTRSGLTLEVESVRYRWGPVGLDAVREG